MLDQLLKELQDKIGDQFDIEMESNDNGPCICIYEKGAPDESESADDQSQEMGGGDMKVTVARTKRL